MRIIIKRLSILICGCLLVVCALTTFASNKENVSTPIRDVELIKQDVDYQALFEEFDDATLVYVEEKGYIAFSGVQTIASSELEGLDLVSVTNNCSDELDVQYSFEYYEDTNLFILNVKIINVDGGEILDSVPGMPFVNENGETDIAFVMDEEVVLLSEMAENPLFENCGWFSSAWKKFAKVATVIVAVAVVVAVVVVAAPAVVAAIPTVSTVAFASGGTAAVLTGGGAAAAMTAASAAAAATLPTIAAATATSLAIAAVDAGIDATKEENSNQLDDSQKQIKDVDKDTLPDNVQEAYDNYDNVDWDDEIYNDSYSKANANTEYKNRDGKLPKKDTNGNDITYKEYDVNDCKVENCRDAERFVKGSDGSIYYTNDHYGSFVRIK